MAKDVAAPAPSKGGKAKKKKWSKGKTKDKTNNLVVFDQPTLDKLFKEVPTYKLITVAVVVDRLRITGALARVGLRELEKQGLIRLVSRHATCKVFTRVTGGSDAE